MAVIAVSAWTLWRYSLDGEGQGSEAEAFGVEELGEEILIKAVGIFGLWRAPQVYAQTIATAEWRYGIPAMLLERLLWQESRYRADVIDGRVRSPAGALGIAQFMPATAAELGIDPLNPTQAIDGAARYLRSLYGQFGNWTEALAAYNWGMGNVARRGLDAAPRETRNYWTSILADVNGAGGTHYA